MHILLHKRSFHIGIATILIGFALFFLFRTLSQKEPDRVTSTVTRGNVTSIVSVSGVVEAEEAADLAFPQGGIVANILVKEGDMVERGAVLATLEQSTLQAERRDAYAALLIAEANREELINGPQNEARSVTEVSVAIAKENLTRTVAEEKEKVQNARRSLYSTDLEALPENKTNDDTPPTITGTYSCADSGEYILSIYKSNTRSGYSYRLSGLETGTFTVYTEVPAPLGSCGLYIQFGSDESYNIQDWTITIPNTRSSSYATNLNTYELALQQQKNNVAAKEQALDLALREQTLENADPRAEALQRANASVLQATARLAAVDSRIADRTLRAPFPGTISSIDVLSGETVSTAPIVTLVGTGAFELTMRIPEIDITKVTIGQKTRVIFDARPEEPQDAEIAFISPLATEIDGVAYFEATVRFPNPPVWLRGGLNADINIIVDEQNDVLRIPKRFLVEENGSYSVITGITKNETSTTSVEVFFTGNDGFVAITGLSEGSTVIAP